MFLERDGAFGGLATSGPTLMEMVRSSAAPPSVLCSAVRTSIGCPQLVQALVIDTANATFDPAVRASAQRVRSAAAALR